MKYFQERTGTAEARFHDVPHDENGWAVTKEGQDNPEFKSGSKSEAVEEAKRIAEQAGTMAYINDEDEKIEEKFSFGD